MPSAGVPLSRLANVASKPLPNRGATVTIAEATPDSLSVMRRRTSTVPPAGSILGDTLAETTVGGVVSATAAAGGVRSSARLTHARQRTKARLKRHTRMQTLQKHAKNR